MITLERIGYLLLGALLGIAGIAGLLAAAARGYHDTEEGWTR